MQANHVGKVLRVAFSIRPAKKQLYLITYWTCANRCTRMRSRCFVNYVCFVKRNELPHTLCMNIYPMHAHERTEKVNTEVKGMDESTANSAAWCSPMPQAASATTQR
jgi:hypothetical protein